MKYSWRITKYNPIYRNEKGHYQKDEWTAISDVGRVFHGKELTIQDYLKIEDLYVDAVKGFMAALGIDCMEVTGLEKWNEELEVNRFKECYSQDMFDLYKSVKNGDVLPVNDVANLCRLILRSDFIWGKLRVKWKMFVQFGYDYYMFIGASRPCYENIDTITKSGLFVEQWKSP